MNPLDRARPARCPSCGAWTLPDEQDRCGCCAAALHGHATDGPRPAWLEATDREVTG